MNIDFFMAIATFFIGAARRLNCTSDCVNRVRNASTSNGHEALTAVHPI